MDSLDVTHLAGCGCQACSGHGMRSEDYVPEKISLDPLAGGTFADKPIYDLDQITANMNRTGYDWYTNNYGELDDGVLNFGFWLNIEELQNSYYVNVDGSIAFTEAFFAADFSTFNPEQRAAARTSMALWDDLIAIRFQETKSGSADITFGNTNTGGAQAYAYLPFGDTFDDFYYEAQGFEEIGRLGGDVWIDGFVPSNFFPVEDSYYSVLTMIHEIGHAIGLSHPGAYNGGGFNYADNAEYAQDTLQYSVMSYWDAYETGAQHIDWTLTNFAYAATPLIHDIAAIQAIYGADPTTRTGNTVYGFNSTADRAAYDFTSNTRPIVAIYDAGGIDTIDFSGWNTPSTIDLNEGAFSSGGGIEKFLTREEVDANRALAGFGPRSDAAWEFYENLKIELGLTNGLYKDNVSIAYGTIVENAIGGGGNDTLIGNQVANVLTGNAGNDTINGNDGDDTIIGGAGQDTMDGGAGNDTVSYVGSSSRVTVNLGNNYVTGGDAFRDKILNFENVIGSSFDDTLSGNSGANRIDGGEGNDTISAATGNDTVNAGDGNDSVRGGGGNDVINGDAGNDTLLGEGGNDIIDGGAGADIMTGGANNDTFRFTVLDGSKDIITDFRTRIDKIDLSGLDAIVGNESSDDSFTWLGSGAFTNTAGELRTFLDGGVFSLGGDTDGDGVADFIVNLQGIASIAQTDIIFA
jgi:Ca2+-binding RTX toxin-like protein